MKENCADFYNQKFLTFLFLLILPYFATATLPCEKENNQINLSSVEILRQVEIQALDASPKKYCDEKLVERFLRTSDGAPFSEDDYLAAQRNGTVSDLIEKKIKSSPSAFSTWHTTLIPEESLRLKATNNILIEVGKPPVSLDAAVKILSADRCSFGAPTSLVWPTNYPENDVANSNFKQDAQEAYACQELLGLLSAASCGESFKTAKRIASIKKAMTGSEIFEKLLGDSRYDEGIRKAALLIADRVKKRKFSQASIFEDLVSEFKSTGKSNIFAEEMAWNTLGLIATAGPNLPTRILMFAGDKSQYQKRVALATIANCIPILDHWSSTDGQLYSLPKQIRGSCNSGKTYHFWYTAFLARRAALETGDTRAAAAVAFQAEKFYQLQTRSTANYMSQSPLFTPASEIVRADLSYAAAGAVFGANQANLDLPALNIDSTLNLLIRNAGSGTTGAAVGIFGGTQGETYAAWEKKFNSNSAFQVMSKAGFPKYVRKELLNFEKNPEKLLCP